MFLSDGATPAASFKCLVGHYDRATVPLARSIARPTDAAGSFAFSRRCRRAVTTSWRSTQRTSSSASRAPPSPRCRPRRSASCWKRPERSRASCSTRRAQPRRARWSPAACARHRPTPTASSASRACPPGRARFEAGDPVTRRRGSARVDRAAGPDGQRRHHARSARHDHRPRARRQRQSGAARTVRMPASAASPSSSPTTAASSRSPTCRWANYLIQAPGPSQESLISFMEANGYDPSSAFTSGDAPAGWAANRRRRSAIGTPCSRRIRKPCSTFLSVDESLLDGLPMANLGGFGWNKVRLFQDSTTARRRHPVPRAGHGRRADRRRRRQRPIGALTRITCARRRRRPASRRSSSFAALTTDAGTGRVLVRRHARFDLATFQTRGRSRRRLHYRRRASVQPGDRVVPRSAEYDDAEPERTWSSGSPARPRPTARSGPRAHARRRHACARGHAGRDQLRRPHCQTGADGRFQSLLPIPAGRYTLTAQRRAGFAGSASLRARRRHRRRDVQLLGLGAATIVVQAPERPAVVDAAVALERGTFPRDRLSGTTDANGQLRFVNVSEGPFSVTAEEALTGSDRPRERDHRPRRRRDDARRHHGVRAASPAASCPPTAGQPFRFAQVVARRPGRCAPTRRRTPTDLRAAADSRSGDSRRSERPDDRPARSRIDELVGSKARPWTSRPAAAARRGRPGWSLQADGTTSSRARPCDCSSSVVRTSLQATHAGRRQLQVRGHSGGRLPPARGRSGQRLRGHGDGPGLVRENEIVDRPVSLAAFGSVEVTVRDHAGQLAPNASATISLGDSFSGRRRWT